MLPRKKQMSIDQFNLSEKGQQLHEEMRSLQDNMETIKHQAFRLTSISRGSYVEWDESGFFELPPC